MNTLLLALLLAGHHGCRHPVQHTVTLRWNEDNGTNTDPLTYNIYRNGTQIATSIPSLDYVDDTVLSGNTYTYTATAFDNKINVESTKSTPVHAVVPCP